MGDLRARLEQQLDELELLQSVFSGQGEFEIADSVSHEQAIAYVKELTPVAPGRLGCSLHLPIDAHQSSSTVDISIKLPKSYPDAAPEVYISCNDLSRDRQDELNSDLQGYSSSLGQGEPCLLLLAEWVRDNASSYLPQQSDSKKPLEAAGSPTVFCRMWLYMHHIYSKTKRKDILSQASELKLTGFCLPGKPGVVCVEGDSRSTAEFYGILRRWNWKSISCHEKETVPLDPPQGVTLDSLRKIDGFCELSLDTHGPRGNHMDMGQFRGYLTQLGLEHMFKSLFGVGDGSPLAGQDSPSQSASTGTGQHSELDASRKR